MFTIVSVAVEIGRWTRRAPALRRYTSVVISPSERGLSERVAEKLVERIRTNGLEPGAPLPSEVEFSATLGVSRGIVREAYRSLAMAGIIDAANGRRPRVGQLAPQVFTYVFQHALATRQVSPLEVLEVRAPIEIRAVELAAVKRTERDAEELLAQARAMRQAKRRYELFFRADIEFHKIIGRATNNLLFGVVAGALRESLAFSIRAGLLGRSAEGLERTVVIHEQIARAVSDGDAATARRYMTLHFDDARVECARMRPGLPKMISSGTAPPTPAARRAPGPMLVVRKAARAR